LGYFVENIQLSENICVKSPLGEGGVSNLNNFAFFNILKWNFACKFLLLWLIVIFLNTVIKYKQKKYLYIYKLTFFNFFNLKGANHRLCLHVFLSRAVLKMGGIQLSENIVRDSFFWLLETSYSNKKLLRLNLFFSFIKEYVLSSLCTNTHTHIDTHTLNDLS